MRYTQFMNTNRALWNARTPIHVGSEFYGVEAFRRGRCTLNAIELELLNDFRNKSLLHLQCHFGLDSLSLARRGAQVTGVDFSEAAIREARLLAKSVELPADFICANIYDLPEQLTGQYDFVFTSYGVIGWLPDLETWAEIIAHYLKPGGQFVMAEFHPVLWMFDNEFRHIVYSYFQDAPIIEKENGTYADVHADIELESVSWNHSLDQVLGALIAAGLRISEFLEFDFSPYNCFSNTVESSPGRFQIKGMEGKLPMVFALKAEKP
jgi:SAM-dependent methyltransferase